MTVTGKRLRKEGIVRARGGTRIPAICMVTVRKIGSTTSAVLRIAIPST